MGYECYAFNENDDTVVTINENSDFKLIDEPQFLFSELNYKEEAKAGAVPRDTSVHMKTSFAIDLEELEK